MDERKMNIRTKLTTLVASTLLVLMSGIGQADDTDIYVAGGPPLPNS